MNAHTDLQSQIDQAEAAGDVYALASILRQLLIERPFVATKPKAAKRVPRITGARELTDAAEIERERWACFHMGCALEAFLEQEHREREMARRARLRPVIEARRRREHNRRVAREAVAAL